jgi:putative DNA primase/helicase
MLAKITGADDKPVNLHVTYLTKDGQKADVIPNRKVLPGSLPEGCAIRLAPAAGIMGVAEGIETAISASILFDMPVWACVNASLLAKWIPPEIAKFVYVFGDNDLTYTGQAAAYKLANRLAVQFRRGVAVAIPDLPETDWNDIHKIKRGP